MLLHCTKKLAAKLTGVSPAPLEEDSPLGSWHGHVVSLDRRQCVLFCHDATRYVLFMAGWRKAQFAELGSRWFRALFTATLAMEGVPEAHIRRAELALRPVRFDPATNRSVLSSLRVAQEDVKWGPLQRVPNVLDLDPLAVAVQLNQRPVTAHGNWLWPAKAMHEIVTSL